METFAGSLHKLRSNFTNKIKNAFTSIFLLLRRYNLNNATCKKSWKDDLSLLDADISARLIIACWCNIHAFTTARASRVLVSPRIMTSHTSRRALLGSLSKATRTPENNDLIGWMRKNNRAARAARTLEQFFDVVCQMTTWNFQT